MKLIPTSTLNDRELEVADYIAGSIRFTTEGMTHPPKVGDPIYEYIENESIGHFIWRICRTNGVNPHRIARHLGGRRRKREKE